MSATHTTVAADNETADKVRALSDFRDENHVQTMRYIVDHVDITVGEKR